MRTPFEGHSAQAESPDDAVEGDVSTTDTAPPSEPAPQLTVRALAVGLAVGSLLACSNMYFGLQTGWVTMGSLQSAILGFGIFRLLEKSWMKGFSMAENVILQTTAVATATMPLAAGLVGIVPALSLMTPEQNPPTGPILLSAGQLILWSLGLAFIGVFCAVPLRTQTIIKEKLRFPSGTATAHVIRTLHGVPAPTSRAHAVQLGLPALAASQGLGQSPSLERVIEDTAQTPTSPGRASFDGIEDDSSDMESQPLFSERTSGLQSGSCRNLAKSDSILRCSSFQSKMRSLSEFDGKGSEEFAGAEDVTDWQSAWKVLLYTTLAAGLYTLVSSLKHMHWLRSFPIFTWVGLPAATAWGWVLSPSLGYVGQGMIMGPRTASSMLAGGFVGWAVLGPIAKGRGWAPGPIMDWHSGAAGWILWVSLAIMLGDSLSSLGMLGVSTTKSALRSWMAQRRAGAQQQQQGDKAEDSSHGIPTIWWIGGLGASAAIATAVLSPMLHLPAYEPIIAVLMALLVSVLAVRALGQTDLNPVSGVGKLSQVVFALVAPGKVVPNLVAGAIAEAGAQQSGDMMQDFKTAHLLGVSPRAQFFAMLLGSGASVFVSVAAYALYTAAWEVPGPELPAPTAMIWLDMASLVNGGKLPKHVVPFCVMAWKNVNWNVQRSASIIV
ncbi:hypothetical protein WJX73_006522 [Symbiochloris irregularis]|uniref:Oligopeptide transporter n=1 Tax=Symbiochloris irregularis TaxID=706552 RepID=A0AAW1NX48_9CHLO